MAPCSANRNRLHQNRDHPGQQKHTPPTANTLFGGARPMRKQPMCNDKACGSTDAHR